MHFNTRDRFRGQIIIVKKKLQLHETSAHTSRNWYHTLKTDKTGPKYDLSNSNEAVSNVQASLDKIAPFKPMTFQPDKPKYIIIINKNLTETYTANIASAL